MMRYARNKRKKGGRLKVIIATAALFFLAVGVYGLWRVRGRDTLPSEAAVISCTSDLKNCLQDAAARFLQNGANDQPCALENPFSRNSALRMVVFHVDPQTKRVDVGNLTVTTVAWDNQVVTAAVRDGKAECALSK